MYLLNFGHPCTAEQLSELSCAVGHQKIEEVRINCHFEHEQPFIHQIQALLEEVGFSSEQWQQQPLLVNLPTLSVIAGLLLAELHGRMGYFPSIVRLKPVSNMGAVSFAFAEVLNLNAIRDEARQCR